MTDERKQAEEILLTQFTDKFLNDDREDGVAWMKEGIIEAMQSYAALKVAEATKEMYPKEFMVWAVRIQCLMYSGVYEEWQTSYVGSYISVDELFEYWKQNIQGK